MFARRDPRERGPRDRSAGAGRRDETGPRFTAAATAARGGQYSRALELLGEAFAAGECSEVRALDLQGRILAQEGRFLEAEASWRRALSVDPNDSECAAALGRVRSEVMVQGRVWPALLSVLVATLVSLLLVLVTQQGIRSRGLESELASASAALHALRVECDGVREELASSLDRDHSVLEPSPPAPAGSPQERGDRDER